MKIGINTYPFLWTHSIEEALHKIKGMGFRDVEVLASPPFFPLSDDEMVKVEDFEYIVESSSVNMISLNLPGQDINLASPFKEMRIFTVNQYKKLIDFAHSTGIPYIVMPPGRLHPLLPPEFEWIWKVAKPHLQELVEYAEKKNVALLIENIPFKFLDTAEKILWVTEEIKSSNFAVVYDVANAHMVEDPVHGIKLLRDKIKLIHLSDTARDKWEHNVIGKGDVDFESVYKSLLEIDYSGSCMLEIIHPNAEDGIGRSVENLIKSGWNIEK